MIGRDHYKFSNNGTDQERIMVKPILQLINHHHYY
jgi:hypothetical protein